MEIRPAARADLDAIGQMAYHAGWTSLSDVMYPGRAAALLDSHYSPPALKRSLLAGTLLVAVDEGEILGFAEAVLEDDHVHMASLCTSPVHRSLGVAARLVEAARALAPSLPVSTDVLLGNGEWEYFYETSGFVPGETIEAESDGLAMLYRRWWSTQQPAEAAGGRR